MNITAEKKSRTLVSMLPAINLASSQSIEKGILAHNSLESRIKIEGDVLESPKYDNDLDENHSKKEIERNYENISMEIKEMGISGTISPNIEVAVTRPITQSATSCVTNMDLIEKEPIKEVESD